MSITKFVFYKFKDMDDVIQEMLISTGYSSICAIMIVICFFC
ncbi:hypothetical protein M153_2020002718 [Pseudoloma neurophilia]|uniref:Uncharacterized protein n=1 Tax=Pseudoloma neurophilia TaxID=146866 RepID=A0A0R0M589_9MICR|nr:hypothetical protein M153_2020002718 [Pseudoloma neurophilia]